MSPWAETSPDDYTDTSTEEHYAQELPSFPFNENFPNTDHKQPVELPTNRPHVHSPHNNHKPSDSNFENSGNYQKPSQSSPNNEHKPSYSHTYVLTVNISSHHKESYHTTLKPTDHNNIPDNFDQNNGFHHFQTPNHNHNEYTPHYSTTTNPFFQIHKHPNGTSTAAPNHFYEFENHENDHNYSHTHSHNKPIGHKNISESLNHFYEFPQKVKPNYTYTNGNGKPNYSTQNHFYKPPNKIVIVPKFHIPVSEYLQLENSSKSKYERTIYCPESPGLLQGNKTDPGKSYKHCNISYSIKEGHDSINHYDNENESKIASVQQNITHVADDMTISERSNTKIKFALGMNDRY